MSFLRFYTEFTSFSKTHILFEIRFYRQAPGTFPSITDTPLVHENALERSRPLQCHPWCGGRRGSPELGSSGGGIDRARAGEWPAGSRSSVSGLGGVGTSADGAARRWRCRPAAGARAPVKGAARPGRHASRGAEWVLGRVPEQSGGSGSEWRGGSAGTAARR
jgi:hypothetical protein